jgi:tRNA A-37 threonylcarbamoyl transferase component Bud32
MTDRLWLADAWRERLASHGLTTVDAFLQWTDGRLVSRRENGLETIRIELRTSTAPGLAGYLKRFRRFRGRWRNFRHVGRLRREAEALQWLQERSLNVPPLLAWGVRSNWGVMTASFVLTKEIEGADTLAEVWRRVAQAPAERRQLLARLAACIGRVHRTGFIHGNLYGRNILMATGSGDFYLIDFPDSRMNPPWPIGAHGVTRDLSGLLNDLVNDLAPLFDAETAEFLTVYGEARWPDRGQEARARMVQQLKERIRRHAAARQIRLQLKG